MPDQIHQLAHGAIESPKDERDWTLASVGAPVTYPSSNFLDVAWMIASMQGQIGCCVGCTFEEIVRQIQHLLTGVAHNPGTPDELSFRFVYAFCKALEGQKITNADGSVDDYTMYPRTVGANDGTYPALAAKVIRKYGVPLAKFCPNTVSLSADDFCYNRILANIPKDAITDAATRKAGADIAVPLTDEGVKQAISYARANKGSVAILRQVGDSYWKDKDGNSTWQKSKLTDFTGIRIPTTFTSGHEEMLYGYDTEPGTNRTRIFWLNHWSPAWNSTNGYAGSDPKSNDGGVAWEYLDIWLPHVREIRVSVAALPPAPSTFKYTFTKQLQKGDKGPDVVALQHVLDLEKLYNYNPTDGSPRFTGNFGDKTFAAVVALQEKYASEILAPLGLSHGTGRVGSATLKWLNSHYGV